MAKGTASKGRGELRRAFAGCFSKTPRADAVRRAMVRAAKAQDTQRKE